MEQHIPIQLLLGQLKNKYEHPTVRIVAIRVLVSHGYSIPVDILRSALRSKDVPLREQQWKLIEQLQGAILTRELYKLLQEVRLKDKENTIRTAAEHILRQMEEADPEQLCLIRHDDQRRLHHFRLVLSCWIAILGYLSLIAWNLYHLLYLSPMGRGETNITALLSEIVPLGPFATFNHSPLVYMLFAFLFFLIVYSLIRVTEGAWRPPGRGPEDDNGIRKFWSTGILATVPIEHPHETSNIFVHGCLGLILIVLLLGICVSIWYL